MERQLIEEYTGTNFNIWDEKWELGYINNSTGQNTTATNQIRSTNYIPVTPNTVYYWKAPNVNGRLFMYGSGKNFITQSTSTINNKFTTGPSVYYLRFTCGTGYGTTYKNDICLNLSQTNPSISPRNGDYVPHQKTKNYVVLETCGQVDLGTLNWIKRTNSHGIVYYVTGAIRDRKPDVNPVFQCPKFSVQGNYRYPNTTTYESSISVQSDQKTIAIVPEKEYADAAAFKQSVQGVILTYELANPKPHAIKNVITI